MQYFILLDSKGNYFNPAYCCNLENFTTNTTKWGLAWAIDNDGKSNEMTESTESCPAVSFFLRTAVWCLDREY